MTRRSPGTVVNEEKICSEDAFLLTGHLNARHNFLGKAQEGKDSNPRFGERSKGHQDTDRNVGVSWERHHQQN